MCKARTQCYAPGAIVAMEKNSSKLVSDKGILHFMNLSSARRKTGENSSKIVTKILYIEQNCKYVHSLEKRQEHERVCDVFLSWVGDH